MNSLEFWIYSSRTTNRREYLIFTQCLNSFLSELIVERDRRSGPEVFRHTRQQPISTKLNHRRSEIVNWCRSFLKNCRIPFKSRIRGPCPSLTTSSQSLNQESNPRPRIKSEKAANSSIALFHRRQPQSSILSGLPRVQNHSIASSSMNLPVRVWDLKSQRINRKRLINEPDPTGFAMLDKTKKSHLPFYRRDILHLIIRVASIVVFFLYASGLWIQLVKSSALRDMLNFSRLRTFSWFPITKSETIPQYSR